ncbi:ribose-phosphate pyrophosphokinase 1-like [Hylobates moloch]|uniref:ribose-phosphate pyrophosphokinase 1-like n=1 Tax=Hylobates moloch TaxID=81572 RepID=UPI0013F272E5|nr:ribose-phosphate pyrophosphokinase 1-like [Hylobates moloch]
MRKCRLHSSHPCKRFAYSYGHSQAPTVTKIVANIICTAGSDHTIPMTYTLLRFRGLLTHGLFSGLAISCINNLCLDAVIVTNIIPMESKINCCFKIKLFNIFMNLDESTEGIQLGETSYQIRHIFLKHINF